MTNPAVGTISFGCDHKAGKALRFCAKPLRLSLLVIGLALAVQVSARAEIRSVTANPAEDCSTQMNIGWHAGLDEVNCRLLYTEKSDTAWAHATTVAGVSQRSEVFDGIDSKTPDGKDWKEEAKFLDYGVTLTGLKPDTEYMYKIVGGDGVGADTVRYFKTAGASEFSFLWVSDVHAYTPLPNRVKNFNRVIEEAIKIEPSVDFVFSTGDMVAWGGSYSFWADFFEQPFASQYMFADVIGNHDWMMRRNGGKSEFFAVTHHNPMNGYAGQEGVCYWFIYGDVLFITLNNEVMRTSPEELAAAKTWAASVIEKQKGNYKRIFIAQHYQWFNGRNGRSSWYDHWKDFCDEHHVTLALSGNVHVYQRTHPLYDDQVVADGLGTVYMVAPSSDGERGVEAGPLTANAEKLAFTYSSHAHSSATSVKTIGCVLVDVGPESIRTRLVYIDDENRVQIADEHTIATLPSDVPRPGLTDKQPAAATETPAPEATSGAAR
ncbi:MAG: large repetitive protein [Candidatus Sumerlaeota bacterium]|nr:large repetitive protein [Candidatus Sumerlaeota bacterium]